MVCTDGFVGKRKVKDWWEDGGFIVESQLVRTGLFIRLDV